MLGFAENFIPGHPVWYYFHPAFSPRSMDMATALFANSVEIPGPQVDALCAAAAAARVFVVIGVTERRASTTGTLYNTQLFIDRTGTIVGRHQKLMPTMSERLVHTGGGGDSQRTWPSEFGRVSGLICGENSKPLAQAVIASQYTRIHAASWPNHFKPTPGFPDMPEMSLLVARNVAYTCKCFVISACGIVTAEMADRLPATDADRAWLRDPARSGGSVIIENVFALPGLGQLITTAAVRRDYPTLEGGIFYLTLIALLTNLLVDLAYAYFNPRVRYGK
jgi:aliphatic nitrilase